MTAKTVPYERPLSIHVGVGEICRYSLRYVTEESQLPEVVEWLKTLKAVGVDIETSDLVPRKGNIATLQLGQPMLPDARAYVIDVRCVSAKALRPVFDVLEDPNVVKVGQNLRFECSWLLHHYGVRLRNCQDTQVTEHVLRAGLFLAKEKQTQGRSGERAAYKWASMAKLCWRYLKQDIDKDHDLRTSFYSTAPGMHSERQLAYAAGDVVYPFYISKHQWEIVRERKLRNILKIENRMIPILSEAEVRGMPMDKAAWRELWQEAVSEASRLERELDAMARPVTVQADFFDNQQTHVRPIYPKKNAPLNYKSTEHKAWLIKEYCESVKWSREIVVTNKRANELREHYGRKWLNDAALRGRDVKPEMVPDYLIPESQFCLLLDTERRTLMLRMLRGQLPRELVKPLMDYSVYEKRISSFGIKFLEKHVDEHGILRTEFHQAITDTGRLSSQPNTMNFPRDERYRKCFIAPKGYKLVILDESQVEPRISAHVSQDPTYLAAFLSHDDIYLRVAENMFGMRPDMSTKEGELMRQMAKIIVLALAYRLGVPKLRDQLTLGLADYIERGERHPPTIDETRDLWNKFFEACPGIKAFQEECSALTDPEKTVRPKLYDDFLKAEVTYVQAPCGRIRFFPPDAKDTYTTSPNAPIQGCSATLVKLAAVMMQEYIDETKVDAYIANMIHDEIVWVVEESKAEAFAVEAKIRMEAAGNSIITSVPILAEFPKNTNGVVDYWCKSGPTLKGVEPYVS